MKDQSEQDRILLREIRLTNLLSFGPDTDALRMERLNLFIGPNGSGKSNLIEAVALMRATPVLPQATSNADVRGVLRRGGGTREWIWKGTTGKAATMEFVVAKPKGSQALRHRFAFRGAAQGFQLDDERIEDERPYGGQADAYFYYRFQNGHPVVNTVAQAEIGNALTLQETPAAQPRRQRKLAQESVNLEVSILAQRRDPELYPRDYPSGGHLRKVADISGMGVWPEHSISRTAESGHAQRPA